MDPELYRTHVGYQVLIDAGEVWAAYHQSENRSARRSARREGGVPAEVALFEAMYQERILGLAREEAGRLWSLVLSRSEGFEEAWAGFLESRRVGQAQDRAAYASIYSTFTAVFWFLRDQGLADQVRIRADVQAQEVATRTEIILSDGEGGVEGLLGQAGTPPGSSQDPAHPPEGPGLSDHAVGAVSTLVRAQLTGGGLAAGVAEFGLSRAKDGARWLSGAVSSGLQVLGVKGRDDSRVWEELRRSYRRMLLEEWRRNDPNQQGPSPLPRPPSETAADPREPAAGDLPSGPRHGDEVPGPRPSFLP